jgi:DNA-binding response OmpR family regulator
LERAVTGYFDYIEDLKIWGEDMYGELKTVAVHINRLREKIEKKPSDPTHLLTVWGAGYRFIS